MHSIDRPTRQALLRAGGLAGLGLLAGCLTSADTPTPTATPSATSAPTDGGLPVGEHTFRTRYQIGDAASSLGEGTSAEWGFTVLLE
ncbi:MAG: hypothetical protein ABEJ05_08885 [Haloglomus sp.]